MDVRNKEAPPCKAISTRRSDAQSSERSVKGCKHLSGKTNYPLNSELSLTGYADWMTNRRKLRAVIR
jgi:hypothetical protein